MLDKDCLCIVCWCKQVAIALATHQATDHIGGVRQVGCILVDKPALSGVTVPRLAALHVRIDVNAAVLGHAACLSGGRADAGHVGVEHIVTKDAAVKRLNIGSAGVYVSASCSTRYR
jgi:beta-lactamase superfamily II metal-dependent hydrolase